MQSVPDADLLAWERQASAFAHDLRDPLHTALGHLALVRQGASRVLGADEAESLAAAERSLTRLLRLTDRVLEFARLGTEGPTKTMVDARKIVAAALEDLAQLVSERGAKVNVGPLPNVQADADDLRRVFQNLIANAIKYNPKERPQVDVSATLNGNDPRFLVSDDGPGLAPEAQGRLFEPFHRGHGGADGNGLGLAICRRIIEAHGGRIGVESVTGIGSTFHFTIPAPA